ncbi:MAG: class I SAM-dependent methyltransferase [Pseudomonadota bacterium]
MRFQKKLRRVRMGLQTVTGLARKGFFIPYRYAEGVAPPGPYPEIEAIFRAAEPQFRALLAQIADLRDDLDRIGQTGAPPNPRWGQQWFPALDAAALYALIRTRKPARVVEVGSGHSTRFAARAISDGGLDTSQICIDPEPRAKLDGLPILWRRELLSPEHADLFKALEPGDIAFFDSSHILMPGTDVDIIYNRLLPVLKPGVLIHIHDILLPDPYPDAWEWRGYNEQNALGPLLVGGAAEPVFSSWYARTRLDPEFQRPPDGALETSLWLERTG